LVENHPTVSWESDEHGQTSFISANVEQVYGYTAQEIYDHGPTLWFGRIHPEDQAQAQRAFERLMRDGSRFDIEYRIQHKDGRWIWLRDRSGFVYQKDGTHYACGAFLDITKRKRAEQELQDSAEKFSKAFDHSPNMMMLANAETRTMLEVNQAYIQRMGYAAEDIVDVPGKLGHAITQTDVTDAVFQTIREADRLSDYDVVVNTRDGKELNLLVFAEPVDIQGKHLHIITLVDITDRKRAEEAMRKSSIIINSTTDAVITTDLAGNITFWNRGAERIYGYRAAEVLGRSISLIYKDENQHVLESMIADLLHGNNLPNVEVTCLDKDQQDVDILLSLTPIKDKDGNITELVGITKDISERKQAEEALRFERGRAQQYLDIAGVILVALDSQQRIILINPKGCEILGYSKEEILGQNWFETCLPSDNVTEVKEVFDKVVSGQLEHVEYYENEILTKDGDQRMIAWHNSVLRDHAGRIVGLFSSGEDITERKQAEAQLQEYQARLRSLGKDLTLAEERERRRIAASLHDGACQSLAMANLRLQALQTTLEPERQNATGEVCQNIEQVVQELRDLTFDLSPPTLYMFGLEPAIEELLDQELKVKQGIRYTFTAAEGYLPLTDELRVLLYQSVRELIINMVKHAQANQVDVTLFQEGETVRVSLRDNGRGFEKEQVKSSMSSAGGFGLFNVAERLRSIGGEMQIESALGQGSHFILTAPLTQTSPAN
jgi:PAS domain S-box-containing protein